MSEYIYILSQDQFTDKLLKELDGADIVEGKNLFITKQGKNPTFEGLEPEIKTAIDKHQKKWEDEHPECRGRTYDSYRHDVNFDEKIKGVCPWKCDNTFPRSFGGVKWLLRDLGEYIKDKDFLFALEWQDDRNKIIEEVTEQIDENRIADYEKEEREKILSEKPDYNDIFKKYPAKISVIFWKNDSYVGQYGLGQNSSYKTVYNLLEPAFLINRKSRWFDNITIHIETRKKGALNDITNDQKFDFKPGENLEEKYKEALTEMYIRKTIENNRNSYFKFEMDKILKPKLKAAREAMGVTDEEEITADNEISNAETERVTDSDIMIVRLKNPVNEMCVADHFYLERHLLIEQPDGRISYSNRNEYFDDNLILDMTEEKLGSEINFGQAHWKLEDNSENKMRKKEREICNYIDNFQKRYRKEIFDKMDIWR